MKSILQDIDEKKCFITGSTYNLDKHHVLNGPLRKWAEQQGLWIYLRHDIHMWLHQTGKGKQTMLELKAMAQKKWEEKHANEFDDVRKEWLKHVRTNYL